VHEIGGIAVAVGALAQAADAVVVALECGVAQLSVDPGNDTSIAVSAVGPGVLELLLEHVDAGEPAVEREQCVELGPSSPVKAPALLEQQELLAADRVAVTPTATEELLRFK
jgi:hypothetical protein